MCLRGCPFFSNKTTKRTQGNDTNTFNIKEMEGNVLSAKFWGMIDHLNGVGLRSRCGLVAISCFLCPGIDDVNELWLEGGSAHQEAIHVLLRAQLLTGTAGYGTSVNYPDRVSDCLRYVGF